MRSAWCVAAWQRRDANAVGDGSSSGAKCWAACLSRSIHMNRMSYNTFLNICCKQLRIPCYKRGYMQKSIEVYNLVKRFGEHAAVDSINFTVGAGEIFGLLGPKGDGKTTSLKILTTLLHPTPLRRLIPV